MNEPAWEIEYSLEARNYLYDSYPYTEEVLIAIERLRFDEDAAPSETCIQIEAGIYLWEVLRHLVLFQKRIDAKPKKSLYIGIVKPLE